MAECLIWAYRNDENGVPRADINGNPICYTDEENQVIEQTTKQTQKDIEQLKSKIPLEPVPEAEVIEVSPIVPSDEIITPLPEDISQPEAKKELSFKQKIEKSKILIGDAEWDFFVKYSFGEKEVTSEEIIKEIEKIQIWMPKIDGIIGPNTLKKIYTEYYAQNIQALPHLQRTRLQAYQEVGAQYPDWKREVKRWEWENAEKVVVTLRNRLNPIPVFDKDYYFWENEGVPKWYINTYIKSPDITDLLPKDDFDVSWVRGFLRQIDGKYVVFIYIDWVINLASYASPWNFDKFGDDAITPRLNKKFLKSEGFHKMHYITGAESSVEKSPNDDGSYDSDPMPYAVPIDPMNGVYSHAGLVDGKLRSHGCVRLPAHYARWIYEIFTTHGEITWDTYY